MSLTVKEKEHWKDRIGRKINIAIEQLKLSDDASDELDRIESEALKEAESSLGLAEPLERFRELVEQRQSQSERLESVLLEIRQKLGSNEFQRQLLRYRFAALGAGKDQPASEAAPIDVANGKRNWKEAVEA